MSDKLWHEHRQMIKLAQDHGLHLAASWAVNMSGKTFSEAKVTECENCKPRPGGTIKANSDGYCIECGKFIAKVGVPLDAKEKSADPWRLLDHLIRHKFPNKAGEFLYAYDVHHVLSFYHPHSPQTDIVGAFQEWFRIHYDSDRNECGAKAFNEIIRKHTKEGGV